jgi:hypothetical protein
MRINELFEALDSSYPYELKNNNYYFTTDAGEQYKVTFNGNKKVEVSFMARGENDQIKDYITGSGDSRKVFGTVINIVNEYTRQHNPEILVFAANNAEPSRVRLYNALASQASRALPGYTFAKTLKLSMFTTFYLTRDNIKVPKMDVTKNAVQKTLDKVFEEQLDELTFHGSQCTKDCSGHKAGYEWNKKRAGVAPCDGSSQSFNNGCNIATDPKVTRPKIRNAQGKFAAGPSPRRK